MIAPSLTRKDLTVKTLNLSDLDAERLLAILNEYAGIQKDDLETAAELEEYDLDTPVGDPPELVAQYQRDIAAAERYAQQVNDLFDIPPLHEHSIDEWARAIAQRVTDELPDDVRKSYSNVPLFDAIVIGLLAKPDLITSLIGTPVIEEDYFDSLD